MSMPRPPRLDIPGYPRHITLRGINGMACLERPADRDLCARYLREAVMDEAGHIALHGFALMTNHIHLVVSATREGIVPAVMQRVGTRYARYFNASRARTGAVFGGRYWASLIGTCGYLFTAMRYVELNSVRAGLVAHPSEYRWSSYRHNAGIEPLDWIVPNAEFLELGASAESRAARWAAFVAEGIAPRELESLRKQFHRRQPIGSPEFLSRFSGTRYRYLVQVPGTEALT